MTFEKFFCELISDEQWFSLLRHYKDETIRKAAEKVFAQLVADKIVSVRPMSENRKHVYNILCSKPGDKVTKSWHVSEFEKLQEKEKEEQQKEKWVPLTGEERQKRLAEFKAMIDSINVNFVAPKMSHKEMAHLGGWDKPKPEDYKPTAYDKISIALESKNKIRECRKKVFLDAFPDASEEEIRAYWEKFDDTKEETI